MLVSTGHSAVSLAPRQAGPTQPFRLAVPEVAPTKPSRTADVQRLASYPEPARGGLLMYSITAASSLSSAGAQVDVRV